MIATHDPKNRAVWRAMGLHGGVTIAQQIARAARDVPDLTLHFTSRSAERSIDVAFIARGMERYAKALMELGLQPGDALAVQAPYSIENMLLFAAAMRLGLRYVPIVGIYEASEIDFILTQTLAKAIAVPETWRTTDIAARLRRLRAPSLRHVLVLEGAPGDRDYGHPAHRFSELYGNGQLPPEGDPNDPAVILYTSGSTGVAKGALHSHETSMAVLRAAEQFISQTGRTPLLSPLPTGHIAGIMAMLQPFVHHIPVIYMEQWDADDAARLISRHGIGWLYSTPFHLLSLFERMDRRRLPTLRFCQVGGAGVPSTLIERADALGIAVCRGYGCTEHPTMTACIPEDPLEKRIATDGRASSGVLLKLVDDAGSEVSDGTPGEIVATGPGQFLGYLDDKLNAAAFDTDGCFRTGDVGVRDDDGFIAIVDRKKDIIIRAGENIASKEVEDVLMRHPAINEAAVIGLPDPTYGERVAAILILREGSMDIHEIRRHFRAAGVAVQKTPEQLIIVDELPRTALGKVNKLELRRSMAAAASTYSID